MAIYFQKQTSPSAQLAQGLGTGLGQGIQNLAALKMQEMQRNKLTDSLRALEGWSPEEARVFSMLPQQAQNQFLKQKMQPEMTQLMLKQTMPKPPTVQEQKHHDQLISAKQNLEGIVNNTTRMIEALKSGRVSSGIIPSLTGQYAPSFLNPETEAFDKDTAEFINLASQDLKGVPSRYRVALLEKEKPGLKHSTKVNLQLAERKRKEAIEKLKELSERYPDLFNKGKSEQQEAEPSLEFPDPKDFKEGDKLEDEQTGKKIILKNGQWQEL